MTDPIIAQAMMRQRILALGGSGAPRDDSRSVESGGERRRKECSAKRAGQRQSDDRDLGGSQASLTTRAAPSASEITAPTAAPRSSDSLDSTLPAIRTSSLSAPTGPAPFSGQRATADQISLKRRAAEARLAETKRRRTHDLGDLAPDASQVNGMAHVTLPDGRPLTAQQADVLRRVLDGESIFFTGAAGTGKSVLLRVIIAEYERRRKAVEALPIRERDAHPKWLVGVTASTGLAALHLNGQTLHAWAGMGKGDQTASHYVGCVMKVGSLLKRWRETQALVIDEVSMISGDFLSLFDEVARRLRDRSKPFGGLQLIVCGDFFQLPPVRDRHRNPPKLLYAFESPAWVATFGTANSVSLRTIWRQKDATFQAILNAVRSGKLSEADRKALQALDKARKYADGIEAVGLCATNAEVQAANRARLDKLPEPEYWYECEDLAGTYESGAQVGLEKAVGMLNEETRWPDELSLRVGAVVMLTTNLPDFDLANGSCGKVVAMLTQKQARKAGLEMLREGPELGDEVFPVVEFASKPQAADTMPRRIWVPRMSVQLKNPNSTTRASRCQVPLVLAWAMTIHKSQGQTIDRLKVGAKRIFESGQLYVALSRATSMEALEVNDLQGHHVRTHPTVLEWAKKSGMR